MRTTRSQKQREDAELAEAIERSRQTTSQPSIQSEQSSQSEGASSPWVEDISYNQPLTPEPTPEPTPQQTDQQVITLIEITNPEEIEQLKKTKVKLYTRGAYKEQPKEHHKNGEIIKIITHQLRSNRKRAIKFSCQWTTDEVAKWETWETVITKAPEELNKYLKEQSKKNKKTWNALTKSKPEILEIAKEDQ